MLMATDWLEPLCR